MLRSAAMTALASTLLASLGMLGHGQTGSVERIRRQRAPIVWLEAGEFTMGAQDQDIARAVQLCAREPFAQDPWVPWLCLLPRVEPTGQPVCHSHTFAHERGAHRVWLHAFGIDRTEVTVGNYQRCVAAGICQPGAISLGTPGFGQPEQPMVGVRWDQAQTYCHWVGGRLPTEAEWERAARGRDRRPFPWGWQFHPRRANHGALTADCTDDSDGYTLTAPVGSYPDGASPEGILDLAGNAAEWVADLWNPDEHYPTDASSVSINPRGPTRGHQHVVRGGSYRDPAFALRTTYRAAAGSGERLERIGFRCAYDPQPH